VTPSILTQLSLGDDGVTGVSRRTPPALNSSVTSTCVGHANTPLIASCWVEGYRCRYRFEVASFMCPAHSCTKR
jgi:hypothetical protein